MLEGIKTKEGQDHIVLIVALVGIALTMFMMSWSSYSGRAENDLRKLERTVFSRFTHVEKRRGQGVFLPPVKVLGPNGSWVDLGSNGGKYTVLNIWATWCTPCVEELPSLKRLKESFQDNTDWRVVAVSIDRPENQVGLISFTKKHHVRSVAEYHDYGQNLRKLFNLDSLPVTLILDPNNQVIYEMYGDAQWHDHHMRNLLNALTLAY
ncbi:MAG: TlpA family protein disulfide reductase [Alphaproteobacteria bacterium]